MNKLTSNVYFVGVTYVLLWLLLDYVGFVFETSPGVSPWYPPHGLSLALLLFFGFRYLPLLVITPMIGGLLVWLPGQPIPLFFLGVIVAVGYGGAAYLLHKWGFNAARFSLRDTVLFIVMGLLSSLFVASMAIFTFCVFEIISWQEAAKKTLEFFVGDSLGVLVLAPTLLVYLSHYLRNDEGAYYSSPFRVNSVHYINIYLISLLLCLFVIVSEEYLTYPPLYLLTLPVLWCAVAVGLKGVVLLSFVLNITLIMLVRFAELQIPLVDLQLSMAMISVSGLVAGSLVRALVTSARLEAVNRDLLATNDSLKQYLAMTSHDLKAPARTIYNFGTALKQQLEPKLSKDERRWLQHIDQSARSLHDQVQNIAALTAADYTYQFDETIPLGHVLDEVAETLAVSFDGKHIRLIRQWDCEPELPVKRMLLVRLFQNLIENAIKHSGKEDLQVCIRARVEEQGWLIDVEDDGKGIPEKEREHVFKPGARLLDASKVEGTGIGLAVCRKIVEALGGQIAIDRGELPGACVSMYFPKGLQGRGQPPLR